jgi:predicted ATPase
MIVSRLILRNWRNFQKVDVHLQQRVFLVGPNASGKSNLLDAFRFLRDIAKPGGGLQKAVADRRGVSRIRCLSARRSPHVEIEVHLSPDVESPNEWIYAIAFDQERGGKHQTHLVHEKVWRDGSLKLDRPDNNDKQDKQRLTQTSLEQINANVEFREIAEFSERISYMHLVPQLLRHPESFPGLEMPGDPFGRRFLESLAKVNRRTREFRLKKIEDALKTVVPQLTSLNFVKDKATGEPHLEVRYKHWRPKAGKQREDQFSDGTLRLIGLLWSLLDGDSLLLLEEPELSLHPEVVKKLAPMIYTLQRHSRRQVILSTHSPDLLSDEGIGPEEVLMLNPTTEGTEVSLASDIEQVKGLLKYGKLPVGDVVLSYTAPQKPLSYWIL